MSIVGSLFSNAATAVSGFSIGTWIKIAATAAVVVVVGGLYLWGSAESKKVDSLNVTIGLQQKTIADAKAQHDLDKTAISNWQTAYKKAEQDFLTEQRLFNDMKAKKDDLDAQVTAILARINSDPVGAAIDLNSYNDRLVCLLERSSGGGLSDGCSAATPGTGNTSSSGAPAAR